MKKEMICIICPRGCHLSVDDDLNVTGNMCPRGKNYALSELTNPQRMITSTVRVVNRDNLVVSVRTDKPISKSKMFEVMELISSLSVKAPVHVGDILLHNILDSDVNLIITKDVE